MPTAVSLARPENPSVMTGEAPGKRMSGDWPVYIDGSRTNGEIDYVICESQVKQWPVTPGTHILRVGRGWLGSPEMSFTVAEGQTAAFTCRLNTEAILLAALFKHDIWIILEPCSPSRPRRPSRPRGKSSRRPEVPAMWYHRAVPLADDLSEWVGWEGAAYLLGRSLGLFQSQEFPADTKEILWTEGELGDGLHDALLALARSGVLERREEPSEQFRWHRR